MSRREVSAAPLFSVVELEVNSMCNRVCTYCPVAVLPKVPPVPKRMSDEVLDRALAELAWMRFAGRVSYHFYNEPLIRKDLHRVVRRVRAALPSAFQLLYTNGDLLTDARQGELIAAGLDHTLVTRHEPGEYPERPSQTVQHSHELVLTNRAGIMKSVARLGSPSDRPCFAPDAAPRRPPRAEGARTASTRRLVRPSGPIPSRTARAGSRDPRFGRIRGCASPRIG